MRSEIIRYRINTANAQAFETAHLKASQFCKARRGYRLLRGQEELQNWILIIEWDSVEGHEHGFRKEPAFHEFFALVKPLFNDIQEMKHYEATPINWKQTA